MSREFLAYDALPYTGEAYPQTHVGAMFSAAWLLGMSPADPARCRVLEVGCADGSNLIAMAAGLPQSTFVGIDGSAVQIEAGRQLLEQTGVGNVTLTAADLRDPGELGGPFDYIIAHGVYAWIAPDAQAALLALCQAQLAERGVAYVSYNAYPGWYTGRMVREMMCYHSRKFTEIPEQLRQARALLRFIADGAVPELHRETLQAFLPFFSRVDDDYLFHDYLETHNTPMLLWDFVQVARQAGLAYLGYSDLHRMAGLNLPTAVRAQIESFTDDPVCQEQYLDFLNNRNLRRTLLCHPGTALQRQLSLERAHRLAFSTGLVEVEGSDPVTFRHRRTGDAVIITEPGQREALRTLQAQAPRPVHFVELAEAVGGEGLESLLLQGVLQGVIKPHAHTLPITGQLAERPEVWWFARHQARLGRSLTSRLHHAVPPTSALEPLVVARLDGQHTRDDLVEALLPMISVDAGDPRTALSEAVEEILKRCAREGLLVDTGSA